MTKQQYVNEFVEMTKSYLSGTIKQSDYADYCKLLGEKLKADKIDLLKFAEYTSKITIQ